MEQQQYGAHVHTREEEREDETGRKIGVSKRRKMRRDEGTMTWMETETETERTRRAAVGCIRHLHKAAHTLSLSLHRSAHSAGRQVRY